jgi:hypothetical protein
VGTIECQQLLGPTLAAQRPEPGTAASSKDYGMEVGFRQRRLKSSNFRLQIEMRQSEI